MLAYNYLNRLVSAQQDGNEKEDGASSPGDVLTEEGNEGVD